MRAKLVLLLPRSNTRRRTKGSVYTVVLLDGEGADNQLFANFIRKAKTWKHERCVPQLYEIQLFLQRVQDWGTAGLHLRDEGDAFAIPESRYAGWIDDLPQELRTASGALAGLSALRLYCCLVHGHLVVFDGNVKHTDRVADEDSNVQAEFNQANRFARQLKVLATTGRLRNSGKTKRLDLDYLGEFALKDE